MRHQTDSEISNRKWTMRDLIKITIVVTSFSECTQRKFESISKILTGNIDEIVGGPYEVGYEQSKYHQINCARYN